MVLHPSGAHLLEPCETGKPGQRPTAVEKARTIKLCFRREDEIRDWTTLEHGTLGEARALVQSTLQNADGLYTEADICIEGLYTERIPRAMAELDLACVSDHRASNSGRHPSRSLLPHSLEVN
jgi:hypothetical protein